MIGNARRLLVTFALAAMAGGCASWFPWLQPAPEPPPAEARSIEAEHALGREDAPVTVVAYLSFTCPHCADWEATVWPAFKARFIDTGKVRFIQRELPTGPVAPSTAAARLTRCAAASRYYDMSASLFAGQGLFRRSGDATAWLNAAGKAGGMTPEQVQTCISRPGERDDLLAMAARAEADGVTGTPAFLVNGKRISDRSLNGFDAAIGPLLKAD